jgi:hypothetical protein
VAVAEDRAMREAAGWLAHQHATWVHPTDLALRDAGLTGSVTAAAMRGRARATAMAAHESPRTTKLDDRTGDEITLEEVERIKI